MESTTRRDFLRMAALTASVSALPLSVQRALAIAPKTVTGTINDVQHVVILMQENRSFDHYFGTLRGVRGFRDRHPIPLPGGRPVWEQQFGKEWQPFTPFHLDTSRTSAQRTPDLNHGRADAIAAANGGKWDRWVPAKILSAMPGATPVPRLGLTMGHYRREDMPFQFALAEAFTICDAYHCSFHGSTTPNRVFLMTGTNDPHGHGGGPVIDNSSSQRPKDRSSLVSREQAQRWDAPGGGLGPRYTFTTYPERLEQAGVSWRIYHDPRDDMDGTLNGVVGFERFAFAPPDSSLWKRGMTSAYLEDFARDVRQGTLPQVSWIVPTAPSCEHPWSSSPAQGAEFLREVLDALTANPQVWASTALFINFDENDGYFDHVPAPAVPAVDADGTLVGASTVDTRGETHSDGTPYGLGPRVPMYVISPWTRGGWVSSEVFDHTSVIRFLEKRFGVMEPNISAWRRAVCGDLTSLFRFGGAHEPGIPALPDVPNADEVVRVQSALPVPAPPVYPEPLFQEAGVRPSHALPYELHVDAVIEAGQVTLTFRNTGSAAAVFHVYDKLQLERIPRRYTVGARESLQGSWKTTAWHLWVYGPNGFIREFQGRDAGKSHPQLTVRYDRARQAIELRALNPGAVAAAFTITANAYFAAEGPSTLVAGAGKTARTRWPLRASGCWYDFTVRAGDDFLHRFAGRLETGNPGTSDPAG